MIQVQGLSMNYGPIEAVKDCTFQVNKGEIVGLVGPNGAGKSTIMKILATQLEPTSGSAWINGFDIGASPIDVRKSLGYLPEQAPLYEEMEVREYVDFVGRARGLSGQELTQRIGWVVERCGLEPVWCQPISELSKGYRQRVGLAQALIHDPPVLILDEPTSGLDPLQIMEIRGLIKELARSKAILFSSHILQEIAAVTDRAVVISQGTIRADGSLEELSREVIPDRRVFVTFDPSQDVGPDKLSAVLEGLKVSINQRDGGYEIHTRDPEEVMGRIARFARDQGILMLELYQERPDLEQIFSALIHSTTPN